MSQSPTQRRLGSEGRRRRVLFTLRTLDSGGIPTHIMTLARGLQASGWQVSVASRGQSGEHSHGPAWFEEHGVRHFDVPFPSRGPRLRIIRDAVRSCAALRDVVDEFQPDLLHVHFRSTSPFAEWIRFTTGTPFVVSLHLARISAGLGQRVASFWGDRTIAISSETRSHLIDDFGVAPERIRTVYNGSDEVHFRPPTEDERHAARATFGLPPDAKVVSMIARFKPVKRHDLLVTAIAKLRARGDEVHALLAGEGPGIGAVQQQAAELGVGDLVHLVGYTDPRRVLWASDVCVLSSDVEGFPCAIVEGMLTGVVCVRTASGGAADQIDDGEDGFVIPPGDPSSLAERVATLLDNRDRRATMAAAAMAKARELFTQQAMVAQTLAVYEETLAVAGRRGLRRGGRVGPSRGHVPASPVVRAP
jgi:glycosyltransferase involved in cell wall biosynthesis